MDVVYVHKQKRSDEIRWSIRSVQKNVEHRNIYVIGDDPHIEGVRVVRPKVNRWAGFSKYHDQINKYLTACELPGLSDDFIALNDDFFITKPWVPQNYHRGDLQYQLEVRRPRDAYRRSLTETKRYLESKNMPTKSYELHTPMVFNKRKLAALIESLPLMRKLDLQIRSIYGNTYGIEAKQIDDVKNIVDYENSALLSTTERYFTSFPIGDYIRGRLL